LKYLFVPICICLFLLLASFPNTKCETSSPFNGISVYTSSGIELTSLSFSGLIQRNNSLVMTLTTYFNARGAQDITVQFDLGNSTLISKTAYVYTDGILYYVGTGKNVFFGSYYHSFPIDPINSTSAILYNIDLSQEAESVLDYFSSTVSNLTLNDVGFLGSIYVQVTFGSSTGNMSHEGFIGFPLNFLGNFTSVSLDFTIPEEYEFVDFKLDNEDMIKIFPDRVQQNLAILPRESKVSELYLEWRIPETPSPPPFYDTPPWEWIIPGLIGIILGILIQDIALARLRDYLRGHKKVSAGVGPRK